MQTTFRTIIIISVVTPLITTALPALAETDEEIAKASQNPVANMISLPLKNKFAFGAGDNDASSYTLEAQPVLLVSYGSVNLINRFIMGCCEGRISVERCYSMRGNPRCTTIIPQQYIVI